MTSFPIPSAGMRPILRDCLAAVKKDLAGSLNMITLNELVFFSGRRPRENAFIL